MLLIKLLASFIVLTSQASAEPAIAATEADVAAAIRFPVEKFKLDNGLTVLIHEDHSLPIVSYHQWYRVGSRDEKPGRTGLAHFFEHLMFKGTEKFKGQDFDRLVQANGAQNNAFTSRDYTGYYMNLPSDKLELVVDIESDRMRNLIFNEQEIKSEREVVKEERRYRVENSVFGILDEATYSTVFKVHPYRWPVVGYMKDLNAATMDDLKEFYRVFYAPNNAVIVVAGDVDVAATKAMIKKYFAKIPSQPLPEKKFPAEPIQTGERSVRLTKDLQSPVFGVAYQAAKAGDPAAYAMDLLSNILSHGPSSRLYRRLVYREQVATDVSAWAYTPADKGVFEVTATLKNNANMDRAINSVYEELYKVRKTLVSAEELQKAKNQIIFGYISGLKTTAGKASALALNEILFGDYTMLFEDVKKYLEVTPEQIQKVAEEYFKPVQRSVIRVQPAVKAAAPAPQAQPEAKTGA